MSLIVEIQSVTGQTPYDVYLCDPYGNNCIFIDRVSTIPYSFTVPSPYDTFTEYKLKLVDGNNNLIFKVLSQ